LKIATPSPFYFSTAIAAIFISDIFEATTIFGSGLSRERVWIKVCYMKSHWNGRRVYIITLNLNPKVSWSVARE